MQEKTITHYNFVKLSITLEKETNDQLNELMQEDDRNRSNELRQIIRAEYLRRHPKQS